jgi:hypothetical protein
MAARRVVFMFAGFVLVFVLVVLKES